MSLPITLPVVTLEVKTFYMSDTEPTAATGYEIVMTKDLGFTKLWMEFKVTGA